jgi:hypothetical protein
VAVQEHLVVVLPGIGGTQLAVPDSDGRPTDDLVWAASLRDIDLLRHPERLSIAEHQRLAPRGLIPTRKAFGLWTVVPGYDGLLKRLGERPGAEVDDGTGERNLRATVVAFGYDFRLGVADAAAQLDRELRERVAYRWPDERDRHRRVVFVAHSMGGLVARYWVSVLGGAPWCRGIITLGTPHRGAPKALEVMANGLPVGPFHIRKPIPLAREWPGMADLLPRYPAVADLTSGDDNAAVVQRLRPHELPLTWLRGPAETARTVHWVIEDGWAELDTPPAVFPRIGFGHGTLRACFWDGTTVRVTKDLPAGPELGGWGADLGDGTVPTFCGLPVEMDTYPRAHLRVHRRHGPIAELPEIDALFKAFGSDAPLSAYRAVDEADVALGLDLDELHLRNAAIPIAATPVSLTGRDVGADTSVAVWATVRRLPDPVSADADAVDRDATGVPVDVRLEWDPGSRTFRGVLPGFAPGLVEVTVTAQTLTNQRTTQIVEVLDDAGLE